MVHRHLRMRLIYARIDTKAKEASKDEKSAKDREPYFFKVDREEEEGRRRGYQ